MLLANNGVLVFHRTPELAIMVGGIVKEAAHAGINAGSLGGPVEIPEELRKAALQRAMVVDNSGTAHAPRALALAQLPKFRAGPFALRPF